MASFTPIYKLRDWIDINKLDWEYLSRNPNAIKFLECNTDKIDWDYLSENHNIFEINKDYLKNRIDPIKKELIEKVFHPKNIKCIEDLDMD